MKRILFAAVLSVAAAGAASAADIAQPPPPEAPGEYVPLASSVYNWGGLYIGINGGWGWGNAGWSVPATVSLPALSGTVSDNGAIIGGTLGVNYQTGAFVFGLEGDLDYSGINTGTTSAVCAVSGNCQTGNNWLSTVRARAGYAANNILFYGTAGGAFANIQTTLSGVTTSHIQSGWTLGAGVEWAFFSNWTAKFEYLFVSLNTINTTCSTAVCIANNGGASVPLSASLTENLVRAGVNYKFSF
jgi:outer membrane immunogenic protein